MNTQQESPSETISTADVDAVYDRQGRKLGKIDHLMIDKTSGQVRSVVLVVKGFLGLGHSHTELPWASLKYSRMMPARAAESSNKTVNVVRSLLRITASRTPISPRSLLNSRTATNHDAPSNRNDSPSTM
jgi:hypothetical protein